MRHTKTPWRFDYEQGRTVGSRGKLTNRPERISFMKADQESPRDLVIWICSGELITSQCLHNERIRNRARYNAATLLADVRQ